MTITRIKVDFWGAKSKLLVNYFQPKVYIFGVENYFAALAE